MVGFARLSIRGLRSVQGLQGKRCGIPHLAKNERDTPNFLYAALDNTACAPFFKERRIRLRGTH
jgi:hypothetical protein